jgi:hypothetical protein
LFPPAPAHHISCATTTTYPAPPPSRLVVENLETSKPRLETIVRQLQWNKEDQVQLSIKNIFLSISFNMQAHLSLSLSLAQLSPSLFCNFNLPAIKWASVRGKMIDTS